MSTIHMMTTSHSLFLPTMLATQNESDSLHPSKGNEVESPYYYYLDLGLQIQTTSSE